MVKRIVQAAAFVVVLSLQTPAFQAGLEFATGSTQYAGINLRITDFYELKPALAFTLREDNSDIGVQAANNFYIVEGSQLQQYLGFTITFASFDSEFSEVQFDGHYGVRHDISEILSLFGELGLVTTFDPVVMRSFRSSIGLTLYFP